MKPLRPKSKKEPPSPRGPDGSSVTGDATAGDASAVVGCEFMAAPKSTDEIGRLGPYRVLGPLGAGGMGKVFLAEDPALRRTVALKVMHPKVASNPIAKARFLREARAQAAVEHDNIILIHQVGEDRGIPFIAMPLLKGQTLAAALKQNPRPPIAEVLRITREIAEGLAAAHDENLVHRDIKPANIWLEGAKRRVKILDFGLARSDDDGRLGEGAVTHAGTIIGTPAYMSPEQARGDRVDARTDLFSLGVVLYQMSVGELPFRGPTPLAILTALAAETPVHPLARDPALPPALADLAMRLLSKDPAGRPATAHDVVEELRRIEASLSQRAAAPAMMPDSSDPWSDIDATNTELTASRPMPAAKKLSKPDTASTPVPPSLSRKWSWIAGGVAGVLVLGLLGWWAFRTPKPKTTGGTAPVVVQPAPEKPAPGELPFFNGKDLANWISDPGYWRVENGELIGNLAAGTHIYTQTEYGDFELSFEAKIKTPKSGKAARAQVYLRNDARAKTATPKGSMTFTGPKCLLGDTDWGGLSSGSSKSLTTPPPR